MNLNPSPLGTHFWGIDPLESQCFLGYKSSNLRGKGSTQQAPQTAEDFEAQSHPGEKTTRTSASFSVPFCHETNVQQVTWRSSRLGRPKLDHRSIPSYDWPWIWVNVSKQHEPTLTNSWFLKKQSMYQNLLISQPSIYHHLLVSWSSIMHLYILSTSISFSTIFSHHLASKSVSQPAHQLVFRGTDDHLLRLSRSDQLLRDLAQPHAEHVDEVPHAWRGWNDIFWDVHREIFVAVLDPSNSEVLREL